MSVFRYTAFTPAGEVRTGELAADSEAAAIVALQDQGYIPVRAEAARSSRVAWLHRDVFGPRRISYRDLGVLTHELATLLEAGLPLDRALETLIDLTDVKALRAVLRRTLEAVRGGASLADALAANKGLPPSAVSMVRAGQAGGTLEPTLVRLSEYLTRTHALGESIKSALVYPAILVVVAGLSLIVVLTVVLPEFHPLFRDAGARLPAATRIVMGLGDFIQAHGLVLIVLGAAAGVSARLAMRTASVAGHVHRHALRLPLWGSLIAKTQTARLSRTLGALAANGVPLAAALPIAAATLTNRALAAAVQSVAADLKEGGGFAEPLARTGMFPPLFVQLVRVGEQSGRLEDMLIKLANIYDGDVARTVERLLALLVPALTIGLGVLIAGVIASVLVAILSLNDLAF